MNDAQMSMFEVLRPMENFQTVYQGADGTRPIAFPGRLDPLAGQTGYDANLLAGVPVPLGGRLLIQIPMTIEEYSVEANYEYQLIWRTRNQTAFAKAVAAGRQVAAYHLPTDAAGRKEIGTGDDSANRIFIPGASDIIIFEQAEGPPNAQQNMKPQRYVPQIEVPWVQPLTENGDEAVWQQGVYQFTSNVSCSGATYAPIWTDASGDELLILCYKLDTGSPWDFTGDDLAFSNTYGNNNGGLPINPNIGIIVSTGTMGS